MASGSSPGAQNRKERARTVSAVSRAAPAETGNTVRERLLNKGAYQWYAGTLFGLAYQAFEIISVWTSHGSVWMRVIATVILAVFYLGYVVLPPLLWRESIRTRIIALIAYWVASFILVPFVGVTVVWVWPLLGAMIAFCWLPMAPSFILAGGIVVAQLIASTIVRFDSGTAYAPVVTLTVLISLFGITRQIMANRSLKEAQLTIASLAAAEERARLARDLHDVLGHSLTVVAVKSELAGRLVSLDPARALAEIADIETLARTALADLRAAVTSYRETDLDSELRAARTALEAAGIEPHLPADGTLVDAELRPLFGWVVREGITNVIRHSEASGCWIELEPRRLRVRDNGSGAAGETHDGARQGNGLRGLRERAHEAGAELATSSAQGGFVLTVDGQGA
jgi:two-component system sensor histidine kinase DesK